MAVPFSKPLYPGGPPRRVGPPRRGQTQNQQQNINTRRPSNGNHQAAPRHHTQAPEPRPQQQQQTPQHQRYQHPIERFLYGDGVIQLDRLSRVTRIAFYALFEAWRLLQDLSPNQTRSLTQGQDSGSSQHQHNIGNLISTSQVSSNNQSPVQQRNIPAHHGLTVVETSNKGGKNLPDVVLGSTQSCLRSSQNSNSNLTFNGESNDESQHIIERNSTPKKKQVRRQLFEQVATCSSKTSNYHDYGEINSTSENGYVNPENHYATEEVNEDDYITMESNNNKLEYRNRRDSEANHHHLQKNRKFFDDHQVRLRNAENSRRSNTPRLRRSSFSTSDLPDLIPIFERVDSQEQYDAMDGGGLNIMNCDYSVGMKKVDNDIDHMIDQIDFGNFSPFNDGKNGYTCSPWEKGKRLNDPWKDAVDYDEEEFDDILSDEKKMLSNIVSPQATTLDVYRNSNDSPWSNSGLLLVELASAFEMSYGVAFENEQERQQYEVYRRIKTDVLRNQARHFYGDNDQNTIGVNLYELGKAVLSQALLTGMWFMLKRIKIV